MGTIVVTEFISLDGVVEAPGGEGFRYENWSFEVDRGPEGEQFKVDEALAATALLLGRKTYEGFAEAWPQYEGELAEKYNGMPKFVVSRTLKAPRWTNSAVLHGDLVAEVTRLKAETDGEISVPGSITLVQSLLEHDLVVVVDEPVGQRGRVHNDDAGKEHRRRRPRANRGGHRGAA